MRKIFLFSLILTCASCGLTPTIPDGEHLEHKQGVIVGGNLVYKVDDNQKNMKLRRAQTLERMAKICAPNAASIVKEEVAQTEKNKAKRKLFGEKVSIIQFKCIVPY